jgi:hypothetical protein
MSCICQANSWESGISHKVGRRQECFFIFFGISASFSFSIRHTPARAREHPFAGRIFSVVDLCFVSTLCAQPRHFITWALPTKHLFDPDGP